jgi:hypothetical protein
MNWLWAYFRRKTMEALLAGAHDALSENGSSRLSDEEAVRALRAMLGSSEQGTSSQALPGPSQPALAEQRRPVGRPRKFQEPPQ